MLRLLVISCLLTANCVQAQVNEDQLGAWYAWFYNRNIDGTPWATQMIVQRRNWDVGGDLQQRLILGQVSFRPEGHSVTYGLGYYHLRHGMFGPSSAILDQEPIAVQPVPPLLTLFIIVPLMRPS